MKTRSLLIALLTALVVGGLGYVILRPDPVQVDLAQASRGPMVLTIDVDGQARVRDLYEISAPITGTAKRAPVRVGDPVVAGVTVVAIVEPAPPGLLDARSRVQAEALIRESEAAVDVAQSKLREAEEALAYSQSQFDRVNALVEKGVASLTQLETASLDLKARQAALQVARSSVQLSQSSLERARAALIDPNDPAVLSNGTCCVEITAPVDGVVLDLLVESERPVASGTALLTLGAPGELEIIADLLSSDAVRLAPGARALVERWGGDTVLEARLRRIEPRAVTKVSALGIEEQRVDAVFDLVSAAEDWAGLGHGFFVFLRIVEWEGEDVLQIPLSATFRNAGGWAVFAVKDGLAERRPVTLGQRNDLSVEVLDGLAEGEAVIVHPGDEIDDGVQVVQRSTL